VSALELVPGDLAVVAPGEFFPADGLIVSGTDLQADESTLTGEAYPVTKRPWPGPSGPGEAPLVDAVHWGYAGTRLLTGPALLRVAFTGPETIYGEIVRSAVRGRRTLLVDLDAQANATRYLLGDAAPEQTVADFFAQFLAFRLTAGPISDVAVETGIEGLRLVPGSPDLADLQSRLEAKHKIYKLRDTLAALDDVDEVLIDTPPALGFFATLMSLCWLIAADDTGAGLFLLLVGSAAVLVGAVLVARQQAPTVG
jgi:hypothetical protein